MKRLSVIIGLAAVALALLTACGGNEQQNPTQETNTEFVTEAQTEAENAGSSSSYDRLRFAPSAEVLTAYGQLLNNACVYLNENYSDKINGRLRKEYNETCERLHNINLIGISALSKMSDEERGDIFTQLEEIENSIFDDVAGEIGVKAELTEAVTTTADKKAAGKAETEPITNAQEESTEKPERITAAQ